MNPIAGMFARGVRTGAVALWAANDCVLHNESLEGRIRTFAPLGGGLRGGIEIAAFQAVLGEGSGELRFEARRLLGGLEILESVLGDLVAGFAIFSQNVPIVRLLFHFVAFVLDALRLEAKFFFAAFGAEFEQVIQSFVEGASVSGLIAKIDREHFFVGDLAGLFVEAGVLEALRAVGEPVGFGHGVDEDGFGWGGRGVFIDERLLERFEAMGIFGRQEFEGAVVAGEAVHGAILRGDGETGLRWAGAAFRVFAIGVEFGERGKWGAGFGDGYNFLLESGAALGTVWHEFLDSLLRKMDGGSLTGAATWPSG